MFRLKSVYIKDYKNIKEQTFDFSNNTGYIALIGLNGSGKSNLLEAISLIFDELYGITTAERVNGYKISYVYGDTPYTYTTLDEENNVIPLPRGEKVCPSSIIACYSGEDLRLWHMAYEKYYMQYFRGAIRDRSFSPKIIYINKYCWKIAFISLLCSSKPKVQEFLKNILSVEDIRSVNLHIDADAEKRARFVGHTACRWYDHIKSLQEADENDMVNANVISTTDMMAYGAPNAQSPDYVFQFLYLLALPEKNAETGQTVDKLITDISITINGVSFDNLSEGEKKMILIECITHVLGNDNSLVLLDEPDAHVHIERKKTLLEAITAFDGQAILTTHSPILANIIQREKKENIFLLKEGRKIDTRGINKLSEISGEEIDFINSSVVVGSKYILVVEGVSDVRCLTKAIEVWSNKDPKYKKLEAIKFISAGGTGDVKEIFTDVLSPQIDYIDKIVFLFDIDDAGKKGYDKIDKLKNEDAYKHIAPKIEAMYYKDDISKNFELEDLFPKEVYKHIVDRLHTLETYRDFKTKTTKTSVEIKDYIKEKASSFKEGWYDGFRPLLDKLINVFGL
ncbi:MAG: hypothetical protein E7074_01865 [Bacteroidales bacterium]|nr:hypothetical protein [Bacteroidales bacterium]